jgi:hypothetical protein
MEQLESESVLIFYIAILKQKFNCLTLKVKTSTIRNGRELSPQGQSVDISQDLSSATQLWKLHILQERSKRNVTEDTCCVQTTN